MTPDRLIATGTLLFGPHWQQPLGVALHVSRRTVLRWAAGSAPIPPGVTGDLAALCATRAGKLQEAAGALLAEAA